MTETKSKAMAPVEETSKDPDTVTDLAQDTALVTVKDSATCREDVLDPSLVMAKDRGG